MDRLSREKNSVSAFATKGACVARRTSRRDPACLCAFALLAIGILQTSLAYGAPIPLATTQVSKYCELRGGTGGFDQEVNVARPFAQATACDLITSIPGGSIAGTEGYASAAFGPGIPQVGVATTGAQISAFEAIAEANFLASVQYAFQILPIATPPGTAPSRLPVEFRALGGGFAQRSGYGLGRSVGVAHLSGTGLGFDDAMFAFDVSVVDEIAYDPVDQEYLGGGFSGSKFVSLFPDLTYTVVLSAGCSTWAGPVGQNAAASVDCGATVDPSIAFDQAAFDALMGDGTFPLSQYYAFAYSENLPIPEPGVYAMLLAGLGVMLCFARRFGS